ncbi:MAG: hypothetical protein FDZ75_01375, partial [Actinobacteria bacterium]
KYTHGVVCYCDRLHNLQAAFLKLKLARLDEWNDARRAAAAIYDAGLSGVDGIEIIERADFAGHVFHLYVIRVADRDGLRDALAAAEVESGVHYPVPLHLTPAYANLGYSKGDFPVSEQLAEEILSLPMHPHLSAEQVEFVVERVREFVGA